MALIDGRTTRVLFTVLLFAIGLGFLYVARRTLIAFLFRGVFSHTSSTRQFHVFERWTKSRGIAIAVIYAADRAYARDFLLLSSDPNRT